MCKVGFGGCKAEGVDNEGSCADVKGQEFVVGFENWSYCKESAEGCGV